MKFLVTFVLLVATFAYSQATPNSNTISVTGDAAINVAPDRVRINFGVQTRNKILDAATNANDASVRRVIAAIRAFQVPEADIQTEDIRVSMGYNERDDTLVDYYEVTKGVQVYLRDVSKFEPLLMKVLHAGANEIYDIEFSTSELRKYRDEARAMAIKAAIEKARDLASAASLKIVEKPIGIGSYSNGGGSWYGMCCSGSRYNSQVVVQNVVEDVSGGGIGSRGTIALGKISVTASVSLTFALQ
jgi:hypothetical protein